MKSLFNLVGGLFLAFAAGCGTVMPEQTVKMNMINVVPLHKGAEKDRAEDIRSMYEQGVIDSTVFICTLVPEGDPAVDKAAELAEFYKAHRHALKESKMPVGILLQATIGHGWRPQKESSFPRFLPYNGLVPYMFCPLDEKFREYICQQVRTLAKLDADFFILDDDVRMYTGRLGGCYCPRHLAEFNRRNNSSFDAQGLFDAIGKDETLARKWDSWQLEGLLTFVRDIRQTISAEKPELPGIFCACAGDIRHAVEIARELAAPGQKPALRINNARYMNDSPKTWPAWVQKTAYQIAAIPENFTIYAETDTFPHNRYSTAGTVLHSLYAWSLLAGCRGGKLWITATGRANDGGSSGAYYRKMLGSNRGFYQEVAAMQPEYMGLIEPLPRQAPFNLVKHTNGIRLNSWATAILGFAGIPFSHEKTPDGKRIVVLSEGVENFTDEELLKFFSGTVLINGDAAITLTERGFSEYMGVRAAEWNAPEVSFEKSRSGQILSRMPQMAQLTGVSPDIEELSTLYHSVSRISTGSAVAPGAVKFRNSLGGTVITTAYRFSPPGYQAYGMLNEGRKNFLTELIDCGIYYPGDAPLHLTVFKDRGKLTLCAVNLGLDVLDELPLASIPPEISAAQMLQPDGSWKNIPIEENSLKFTLLPMQIAFVRLL